MALNPEAPEFVPGHPLTEVLQNGYSVVRRSVVASNRFPRGASLDIYKTYTSFYAIKEKISQHVLFKIDAFSEFVRSGRRLYYNDDEGNFEKLIDRNDNMLEKVNYNIDILSGDLKRSNDMILGPAMTNMSSETRNFSTWNLSPIIAKSQIGNVTLFAAKNIARPQINFKDKVDNTGSLWVPKIADKPNNIKPLALKIIYNDDDEPIGYEHPYLIELDRYTPQEELLKSEPEPTFPLSLNDTKLTLVETETQLLALIEHLSNVDIFSVDVENHSYRSYQGITCLIQLTTESGGDFIIDALALREHIHKLNIVFTDPKKLKIFHGANMDVLWLQRDFGVYIVGLFDTYQAAKMLEFSGLSLKYLLTKYCQVDPDKKYQLADWRIRPLPEELLTYARTDTHYLIYIWKKMKEDLLNKTGGIKNLLLSVFTQSQHICKNTYSKPFIDDNSHMQLYYNSRKSFNTRQMSALKNLFQWRDTVAREEDESTGYILPNHMLLNLAETLPREMQGINACCSPMPPHIKQNLHKIHKLLLVCREMPLQPNLYQMPPGITAIVNHDKSFDYKPHDLTGLADFRNDLPTVLNNQISLCDSKEEVPISPEDSLLSTLSRPTKKNTRKLIVLTPFERYKRYRAIVQAKELEEYRKQELRAAILAQENTNRIPLDPDTINNYIKPVTATTEHKNTNPQIENKKTEIIIEKHEIINENPEIMNVKPEIINEKHNIINEKHENKYKKHQNKNKKHKNKKNEINTNIKNSESEPGEKYRKLKDNEQGSHFKPFQYKKVDYNSFAGGSKEQNLKKQNQKFKSKKQLKKNKKNF